jgi:uncharacterized membrane protein
MNNSMMMFILVSAAAIFAAVGALFLKKGSAKFKIHFSIHGIVEILTNYVLMFGVLLYGLSSVFFIMALKLGELSVVYPLTSLSYVFVTFLSIYFLKERMNWYKWAGIGFIILGVVLVKL